MSCYECLGLCLLSKLECFLHLEGTAVLTAMDLQSMCRGGIAKAAWNCYWNTGCAIIMGSESWQQANCRCKLF